MFKDEIEKKNRKEEKKLKSTQCWRMKLRNKYQLGKRKEKLESTKLTRQTHNLNHEFRITPQKVN
jgi:hypothetical protein